MILAPAFMAAHLLVSPPDHGMIRASWFGPMVCKVETAPHIEVNVKTDDIDYDYSHNTQQLAAMETNKASPYPPGVDTATGGLRADHPTVATQMDMDIISSKWNKTGCVRYKTITIEMHLRPQIYVAKEYDNGACRNAVLKHELKHVQVDREVANKYAGLIAQSVQDVVNHVGAIGPFEMTKIEVVKAQASGYVTVAMDRIEKAMTSELQARQRAVDSLEEYRQVGSFCRDVRMGQ